MLIERADVLASLEGLLGEAAGGSGRLIFLGGEAGVGKTTLATALAQAAEGRTVRRGCCDGVTTAEPLGPILDALPELAATLDQHAGASRLRLFWKVRDVLLESPVLLILEDVHWADEATLDILRYLGRRLAGSQLMILATFRSEELSRDHPLTVVLGDLATLPGVMRMRLPPLSAAGVRQLLDAAGSDLDATALFRRTGGNPFYVTEVIAGGSERVPATVRDAVLARVSRLSQAAQEVAGLVSVLGRRAETDFVASVSGRPLAAVDECVDRGVLVIDGNTVGFRHDLARLAVEQSLPKAECARAHFGALARLLTLGSDDHRRLAHHAAGCGDRDAVARHAPFAAERAARLGAHRQAAEHLQVALRYHEAPDRRRAELLDQLSYECYLIDRLAEARASGLAALAIYEQEQDARAVGRAQRWLSRLTWFLGQNADSERYAAAAVTTLEQLGPSPQVAMAYSNMAQLRMLAYDNAEAVHWSGRAIELARRFGDREIEMHALNNLGTALAGAGELTEGLARLMQSLDMALADDAHEHAARAYTNLGAIYVDWRLFREADRSLQAGISYCADRDLDTWRLYMSAWLARSLAEQGRYASADEYLADVLRHPHVSPMTQVSALPVVGVLAARRGGDGTGPLDEALPIAIQTGEYQRVLHVAIARAEAAWIAGRFADLSADIDRAWRLAITRPEPWVLGELSWWLHLAGERRQVPAPLASPFALMLAGEHRAASGEWRDLGCVLWSAYALAFSPQLHDAQECLEILTGLGVPAVRQAVVRDRHARGLAVPRGPRPVTRASLAGLTAREAEVLQLLAEGLSYAEVAERLVLSERTVGHHVSAVLRKLGEPTRSRAVATALRLGVIQPR